MEINYHPMTDRPMISCKTIMLTRWFDLYIMTYSKHYDAFGLRDEDSLEERQDCKADEDVYIGWAYADELRWQMVRCAHEVQ